MAGDSLDALDALDEARAWRTVASAVCDAIPAVEVDHSRDFVHEVDAGTAPEEFAVDTLLVSRVRSELQDDARDRYQRLARELELAGFAIVRTR